MSPSYFLQRVCSFYLPLGSDAYRSCRRALYLLHCTLASCLALWYDIVHTYLVARFSWRHPIRETTTARNFKVRCRRMMMLAVWKCVEWTRKMQYPFRTINLVQYITSEIRDPNHEHPNRRVPFLLQHLSNRPSSCKHPKQVLSKALAALPWQIQRRR